MHVKQLNKYHSPKKPSYSDKYYTRFRIGGKPFRVSTSTSDLAEAEKISLELYREQVNKSADDNKVQYTVDKVLGDYAQYEGRFKASFKGAIKPRLMRFHSFFGKDKLWNTIKNKDVADYVNKRRQEKVKVNRNLRTPGGIKTIQSDTSRHISPETINKELNTLNHINGFVKDKLSGEPAPFNVNKHKLNIKSGERRFLLPGQVQAIVEALPDYWADAFKFCVVTGIRSQHVFARRNRKDNKRIIFRRDIDMVNRILLLRVKSPNEKDGKILRIPLVEEAIDILIKRGVMALKPEQPVFVYPEGHKYAGQPLGDFRKPFYRAMEAAGFDRRLGEGMHVTRHTLASWMVLQGVDIRTIQQLYGHASINTTQLYSHVGLTSVANALERTLAENVQKKNGDRK